MRDTSIDTQMQASQTNSSPSYDFLFPKRTSEVSPTVSDESNGGAVETRDWNTLHELLQAIYKSRKIIDSEPYLDADMILLSSNDEITGISGDHDTSTTNITTPSLARLSLAVIEDKVGKDNEVTSKTEPAPKLPLPGSLNKQGRTG